LHRLFRTALNGNDAVHGSDGADVLLAYNGDDTVRGGAGADRIDGGVGDDMLVGGAGNDTMWGGYGNDTAQADALRRQAAISASVALDPLTGLDLTGVQYSTRTGQPVRDLVVLATLDGPDGTDTLTAVEAIRFIDGTAWFGTRTDGAAVHRLYLAALGREADAPGFGAWTTALETGTVSLNAVAAAFTDSAEFARRYGTPAAEELVTLLYANVLGRAPEADGLASWTRALKSGALSLPDLVLSFSESVEFVANTAPDLAAGLWAPDPAAVDTVRLYLATLDRLPDAGGLAHWIDARKSGLTADALESAFIGSAEFEAKYGAATTDAAFVDLLYRNVLDRTADAEGLAFWAGALDSGRATRAEVVHGLAFSDEMTAKIAPLVSDGVAFA
jgi:hypothetical protein